MTEPARPSPSPSIGRDPESPRLSARRDRRGTEGVIQRQGDGYPLDQSRVAYLRYLRRERRQSRRQRG
jgi:hypothetical protein